MPARIPNSGRSSRVDRVASHLGIPTEDLEHAMRSYAAFRTGEDAGRIAALSVRVGVKNGHSVMRYSMMDDVAQALELDSTDTLRWAMREVARDEGKETGVWTMSVRVW